MSEVKRTCGRAVLRLTQGDITHQRVDVIANAANCALRGGGGVDGAIHRAAGAGLLDACRIIGGCATGSAVLTPAFALEARFIAHAVGPVWSGGTKGEAQLLAQAYRCCLKLACDEGCRSIAFPSISTGVYGYPVEQAALVALAEVMAHLTGETTLVDATFILFDSLTFEAYRRALDEL